MVGGMGFLTFFQNLYIFLDYNGVSLSLFPLFLLGALWVFLYCLEVIILFQQSLLLKYILVSWFCLAVGVFNYCCGAGGLGVFRGIDFFTNLSVNFSAIVLDCFLLLKTLGLFFFSSLDSIRRLFIARLRITSIAYAMNRYNIISTISPPILAGGSDGSIRLNSKNTMGIPTSIDTFASPFIIDPSGNFRRATMTTNKNIAPKA